MAGSSLSFVSSSGYLFISMFLCQDDLLVEDSNVLVGNLDHVDEEGPGQVALFLSQLGLQ